MGDVEGMFIADEQDVQKAVGSEVYFGEILGKHSQVNGPLEEKDLTILSEDQDFIGKMEKIDLGGSISGYNPLDYLQKDME